MDTTVLVSIDFSKIEPCVAAHLSQDETMLYVHQNRLDPYIITGAKLFNVDESKVASYQRTIAKTIELGTMYGLTASGLYENLQAIGITEFSQLDCETFISSWYGMHPGFRRWQMKVIAEARNTGRVRTPTGRYRLIPEMKSELKWIRSAGMRQAVNAPIQMYAGEILKRSMADLVPVYRELNKQGITCLPLLQVHDELVFEVSKRHLRDVCHLLQWTMETAVTISVPIRVDVEVGYHWSELKPLDEFLKGE